MSATLQDGDGAPERKHRHEAEEEARPRQAAKEKRTLKTKTLEERQAFWDKKAAKARQNEEEKAGSLNNAEDSQKRKRGYETPTNMQARLDSESSQKRMKLGAEMRKLEKQKSYLEYFPQIE